MNRVPALPHFPGGQQLPNLNRNKKPGLPLPIDKGDLHHRYDRIVKNADIENANITEEDKIKAMITQSSQEYDTSNYVKRGSMTGPVPSTYMCNRCKKQGHHWIKNCPTNNHNVKRSTGIPRSFMVSVDGPQHKGARLTSTGDYAVHYLDYQAYKEAKKKKPPFVPQDESKTQIPGELLCMICKDLLQDAVTIPCCGNSFCDDCVRQVLLESENHECPECHKTVSPDTLIPNRFLRISVLKLNSATRYTCVRKLFRIKSPSVHVENMESPQLSHDSTVGNLPQQTEISSRQNIEPDTEEKPASVKLEMPSTLELKVEINSTDINDESSQPLVSPKSGLDEDSLSQDVRSGTPLTDEPPFDLEQPALPIQAITYSSEPKPISTIETVNMYKHKFQRPCLVPVHQQFPNRRYQREDKPDFYSHRYYPCRYDRSHADRRSQRPGFYSTYNRSPQSRYHNSDYYNNDNNQDHGYDVEYDNHSHSEKPFCRYADSYRISAHPVAVPPLVSVNDPVASWPVAPPTLPASQVFPPQPQSPGALPVNTHIASEPPPPGVEPLFPLNVLSDPPASFSKPPLCDINDRSIDDKVEAFQRDHSFSRDGSRSRSRSSDKKGSRCSSQSRSYSFSMSWSRSPSRSSSVSRSRSYSLARPRSSSKTRSYTQSLLRTQTTESSRSHSRSRAKPRFRSKVESRKQSCSPHSRNRSRPYFPKNVKHFPHRNITYVSGRHYTSSHYGTSYQSQYGPPISSPVLRQDYPPHRMHSIYPAMRKSKHYLIDRQTECDPSNSEVYSAYNTYQQHPGFERKQRPENFDKNQDYQREFISHQIPRYIGKGSHDYKQAVRIKELAEKLPFKKKEEKSLSKHKKHRHHKVAHRQSKKSKNNKKIPVVKVKNKNEEKFEVEIIEAPETEEKFEFVTPAVDPKPKIEYVSEKKPLEENHTKIHDTSEDILDIFVETEEKFEFVTPTVDPKPEIEYDVSEKKPREENHTKNHDTSEDILEIFVDDEEVAAVLSEVATETVSNEIEENIPVENEKNINSGDEVPQPKSAVVVRREKKETLCSQGKPINLDRSNYRNKIKESSSHRIASTSSNKGADQGRDIKNAVHHRRHCPKGNLSCKLRTSHDSRDKREKDIGNRRIERNCYYDEWLRGQQTHMFAEDRNIHSSLQFSSSCEVSRSDGRRSLNVPLQSSHSVMHYDRDNIQVSNKSRQPATGRRSKSRSCGSSESHNSFRKMQPVYACVEKIPEHRRSIKDHSPIDSNENRPKFKHSPINASGKHSTKSKNVKDFHPDLKFKSDYDAFSDVAEKENRECLKRKSNSPETNKKKRLKRLEKC